MNCEHLATGNQTFACTGEYKAKYGHEVILPRNFDQRDTLTTPQLNNTLYFDQLDIELG